MADKRRKRAIQIASAVTPDDTSDLHASLQRDGSRSHSDSATRTTESWMTRVTHAMGHGLFSSKSKRLSGSKSTQVMPVLVPASAAAPLEMDDTTPRDQERERDGDRRHGVAASKTELARRQVSSENSLGRLHALSNDDPAEFLAVQVAPSPSTSPEGSEQEQCCDPPSFVGARLSSSSSGDRAKRIPAPMDAKTISRAPQDRDANEWARPTSICIQMQHQGTITRQPEPSASNDEIRRAAPVLRDFFARDASVASRLREKQCAIKREEHYRRNLERQAKLRVQHEREQAVQQEQQQQERAKQLKAMNRARRVRLLEEATRVKQKLVAQSHITQLVVEAEREQWDAAFEQEMHQLAEAFRKASRARWRDGDDARPMTVAGLAVPELTSRCQRQESNVDKRIKTALPMRTTVGPGDAAKGFDILCIDHSSIDLPYCDEESDMKPIDDVSTTREDELMREREILLRRIAELEKEVAARMTGEQQASR